MKRRPSYSWLANKLLKIRDVAFQWVKLRVGNGLTCRFWSDHWSPFGKLSEFLSSPGNQRLGIPLTATLHQLCCQGQWQIPNARTENQVSLSIYLTTLSLGNHDDYYECELEGKVHNHYSTGMIYRLLREESPQVPWGKIVWIQGGIPKHNFLTWLLVLNRCPTRDRLLSWGLQTNPLCLLCNSHQESRDHIFFTCQFAWFIWSKIARRCGIQAFPDWSVSLNYMQALPRPKPQQRLSLLAWQCSLYAIWTERNHMLHRQKFNTTDGLLRIIDYTIRNKITSLTDTNSALTSSMFQQWFSSIPSDPR